MKKIVIAVAIVELLAALPIGWFYYDTYQGVKAVVAVVNSFGGKCNAHLRPEKCPYIGGLYVLPGDASLYLAPGSYGEEPPEGYNGTAVKTQVVKVTSQDAEYCFIPELWNSWVDCKDLFEIIE